jgi:hypothetical protein
MEGRWIFIEDKTDTTDINEIPDPF